MGQVVLASFRSELGEGIARNWGREMKAIVTGAAGFIGSHVSEVLVKSGHDVLGLDDLSGGFLENLPERARSKIARSSIRWTTSSKASGLTPYTISLRMPPKGCPITSRCSIIKTTSSGTANVLSSAYRAGAKHFVFTSSIAAYGHPHSDEPFDESTPCSPCDPYGTAKLACEHHIRAFEQYFGGPTFTIFRPHNVFGPRQNISDPYRNVVGIFMARALAGAPMPVFGDGQQTRSFSYVSSVARAIADAPLIDEARNATFNIGGDEPMSVAELAGRVSEVMGVPLRIESLPPRKEVMHAHCRHDAASRCIP